MVKCICAVQPSKRLSLPLHLSLGPTTLFILPGWGGNGCGDDLFSYAFDGTCLWTGAKPLPVRDETVGGFRKGDVIGCALDLSIPQVRIFLRQMDGYPME